MHLNLLPLSTALATCCCGMQVSECRLALLSGLLLMLAPLVGMLFFDDDLALGKASEAVMCACWPFTA